MTEKMPPSRGADDAAFADPGQRRAMFEAIGRNIASLLEKAYAIGFEHGREQRAEEHDEETEALPPEIRRLLPLMQPWPSRSRDLEIHHRHTSGESVRALAERYSVSTSSIGITLRNVGERVARAQALEGHLTSEGLIEGDAPVDVLPLCARTANCLKNNGIRTAGALRALERKDLRLLSSLGELTAREIETILPRIAMPPMGDGAG